MTNTHLTRILRASSFLGCTLLMFAGASSVQACPKGTVFSAYKGNGICAWIGKGAQAAVYCTIRKGSCPNGTTHEHKNSDKKNDYCCSKKTTGSPQQCYWEGTAPFCMPNPNCRPGFHPVKSNKVGDGDKCVTGLKIYCCDQ